MKQVLFVLFAGALASAAPVIRAGGIVNAASFRVAGVPGSGLAQGSLATAFGSGLGPVQGVSAGTYPLGTTLAGVAVRITQGSNTVNAFPVFVVAGQVNFLIPSTTPVGAAEIRVIYNGESSAPETVQIVRTALGLFTFNYEGAAQRAVVQNFVSGTETPVNLPGASAKPGQTLIAYGTGLGPISAPDNLAAPAGDIPGVAIEILVGGVPARRTYAGRSPCCSGLDQIVFELSTNTPLGCTVPVTIRAGDTYSNLGDISVARDGGGCVDLSTVGDGVQYCVNGSGGYFSLIETYIQYLPSSSTVSGGGSGFFARASGCSAVPALGLGTCSVTTRLSNSSSSRPPPEPTPALPPSTMTVTYLDAGATLTLRTPAGEIPFLRSGVSYMGQFPPFSFSDPKLMLTAGNYTFTGPGGRDVGALNVSFPFAPLRVTSHVLGGPFDASQPPTIRWSGGEHVRDYFNLGIVLTDDRYVSTIGCTTVGGRAGSFTVPAWVWNQIPTFRSGYALVRISGGSFLDSAPMAAPGLDLGIGFNFQTGHNVQLEIR